VIASMAHMAAATPSTASGIVEAGLMWDVWNLVKSAQTELMLFVCAMVVYFVLFMQRAPRNHKLSQKKFKMMDKDSDDQRGELKPKAKALQPNRSADLKKEAAKESKTSPRSISAPQTREEVVASPPALDIGKHITMIRGCAFENNLTGAMNVFVTLQQSGAELNSIVYNTVLDACVECRNLKAAESWMETMKHEGMTDVVTFNTLIKAHLQDSNFSKARNLMEDMKMQGLQPNRVTFNEIINAMVTKGGEGRRKAMWDMVEEMKAADVAPNQVTISILLKSLNYYSAEADVLKTLNLIKVMEEPMDEVLLSSVVEACVRVGKPELLKAQLKQLHESATTIVINGSHTFGSLIKAYGHAKDVAGIWRCWKEMRSRHIKPTSITLGCMVEAIVSTGDTEGAVDLIHQMQDDEHCHDAVNSVIYCSVLKGFTREKKMDRVWAVYQEMCEKKVELSIIMYNTILDACARCGRMDYLTKIEEDIKVNCVQPNVITYSTMLKGHCQNGNMQAGFAILEQMKKNVKLKPDEIVYNSLLDGCAQNSLVDDGLRLLEEMQKEGVPPSNFTLSILVKLMNRARRLDRAFGLVDEITKKYSFKPNMHVYTNLIQACASNQQLGRGLEVLEQMMQAGVAPDSRTYQILIRSSISKGLFKQADGLLRGCLGLPNSLPCLQQRLAICYNLDYGLVNETLSSLADRGQSQAVAVPLLSDIRQHAPKVRIDAATQRKVMSPCLDSSRDGFQHGKGKGKGGWNRA